MKRLAALPLAALLWSCTNIKPVEVAVPNDPLLLNGRYTGTMQERLADAVGPSVPAQLTSTATYLSRTQYRASGTLHVAGQTYTFTGVGKGDLVTFTTQTSPRYPRIDLEADLLLNGEKVGRLRQIVGVPTPPRTRLDVTLNNRTYELFLDREGQ